MITANSQSRNADYLARARKVLPGGSFNSYAMHEDADVVVASGKGCRIKDADGREYIDLVNGSGPMILGHAHPEVVEALREAVSCPSNFYVLNERGIELAERLVEAIPCAERLKYGTSGSDATFFAMRIARAFTGRNKILKFEGAFLGINDYALMSMGPPADIPYPKPVPDTAGIPTVLRDEVLIAPFNDIETTRAIIESNKDDLAAVIIEAQQRCIDPKPGFLEALREICTLDGIVLIFDEVVTGFRLAYGGSQEFYGITPDLATYGKIIGGGLPLSAFAGRADIMELANPRKSNSPGYSYISSTMSGNIIAATAGLATLDVLKRPGTYERLFAVAERIREGIRQSFDRHSLAAQALGNGPIIQFAFNDREVTDYRTSIEGDSGMLRPLIRELVSRGVLTHGKFYCNLAMTDADADEVVSKFDDALTAVLQHA